MPTACAPTAGRERSSAPSATRKPSPSLPSRFSTGTSQSARWIATVGEPRTPILRSSLPSAKPGNVGSTRNAVTPLWPRQVAAFLRLRSVRDERVAGGVLHEIDDGGGA